MKVRNRSGSRSEFASVWTLAALGLVLLAPTNAVAQLCTAALDVDIHYCRDNSPVPCDPLAFTDGMPVELTVEVTNNSQFQPLNPPADPPSGFLQVGATFKVYYSCSASTCLAGEELPNWFSFVGVKSSLPGVSFADDGNGYSGTITITAPVNYASGDKLGKDIVVLDLIANQPPGAGVVFARAGQPTPPASDSSDVSFLVDDPGCLPGLTGGGQGSTAGIFAGPPLGNDFEPCFHPNKQNIKIDRSGPLEYSNNRFGFALAGYDPSVCDFTFGYANANGTVYSWTLQPGDIQQAGKCYVYQDKNAKNAGGVQRVFLCPLPADRWCLNFKGWGDFDANLTLDEMPMTVSTCANNFSGPPMPIWKTSSKKWTLPISVWP